MSDSFTRDVDGEGSLLSHVLAEYLEESERTNVGADRTGLRDKFVGAHPEIADQLRRHFEHEDFFGQSLRGRVHAEPRSSRYSQLTEIGQGAMGVVYRGFDDELKRWVALKVATFGDASSGEARRIREDARVWVE